MRVHAVVAGWLLGTGPSGANRRLVSILRAAAEQLGPGEEITLLHAAHTPPPDLPAAIRCLPVAIPPGPAWRRALAERRILPGLLESLGATVYEQAWLPLARKLPVPACLTLHDLRDLTRFQRYPRWLYLLLLRRSLERARYVVVPSRFTWEELKAVAGDRLPPTTIVQNGVETARFAAAQPQGQEPCYLHVGRLEPRKNLLMLLSAYAQVLDDAADPQLVPPLVFAGADGGAGKQLAERAAFLEVAGKVHFLGQVDEDRLLSLYAAAVAVLVPSLYEGFGLCALEGLAAGKLVVASDRGALPEIVEDSGVVVGAGDTAGWARAMRNVDRLAHDPFLSAARTRRVKELSWERAAASVLELWWELSR